MDILSFIDNIGALSALIRGLSPQEDAAGISYFCHLHLAALDCRCYFERVECAAYLIDEMSRVGPAAATKPAWQVLNAQLPAFQCLSDLSHGTLMKVFQVPIGHQSVASATRVSDSIAELFQATAMEPQTELADP